MTNLFRSTSQTYTDYRDLSQKMQLGRGLLADKSGNRIAPDALAVFVASEKKLVMRQVIGVVDKVIKKRRYLSQMSREAYIHRAKLAECVWQELLEAFRAAGSPVSDKEREDLRERWISKAHPYRKVDPDGLNPDSDGNAIALDAREEDCAPPEFATFQGPKWFGVFWQEREGYPDYRETAKRIISHLFVQEYVTKGDAREERKKDHPNRGNANGVSLMHARGNTASSSVSDPRIPSKKLRNTWGKKTEQHYFRNGDVAATIHAALCGEAIINDPVNSAWFGARLNIHFKEINGLPEDPTDRQAIWNLHNAIRGFYSKLSKTDRFRRAQRNADSDERELGKLSQILPNDSAQLLLRLRRRNENADLSQLIRLGKLLVHAGDSIADDGAPASNFEEKVRQLATSDGQSEIKRIETFGRTWRKSNALATRTLTALIDPDGKAVTSDGNQDITTQNPAVRAFKNFKDNADHLDTHIPVVFGSREFDLGDDGPKSRSSILLSGSSSDRNERLWALMRIAAGIRNNVYHFNVRRRLLNKLRSGIVVGESNPNVDVRQPPNQIVQRAALDSFSELLTFDRKLRQQAIRDNLVQMKAATYLNTPKLKEIAAQVTNTADTGQLLIPKFKAVVHRAQNLRKSQDTSPHPDLSPLATAIVGNEPGVDDEANVCRVGLLRMVYGTGFRTWLTGTDGQTRRIEDKNLYETTVQKVLKAKDKRTDNYHKAKGRKVKTVSELAEKLELEQYSDIEELVRALASLAIQDTGQDRTYNPDRRVQSRTATEIEEFKQEFFAHLFAEYLRDQNLHWIGEIIDEVQGGPGSIEEALRDLNSSNLEPSEDWHSQFYAWLYLVPPEEASLLRHQMRKSVALEGKRESDKAGSDSRPDETSGRDDAMESLRQIDELIGLYTEVQATGFKGDEHKAVLLQDVDLYEKKNQFDLIYSENPDEQDKSLTGTRRGLRQMIRYAHQKPLEPIFKEHKISDREVQQVIEMGPDGNAALFDEYFETKRNIIAADNSKDAKKDKNLIASKPGNIRKYTSVAYRVAAHNFTVKSVRLEDHVRLHRMMMQLIAKLTDYTLMWERDRIFAFVGMIYREFGAGSFTIASRIIEGEDALEILPKDDSFRKAIAKYLGERSAIHLVTEKNGFNSINFAQATGLLGKGEKEFLLRFVGLDAENKRDEASRLQAEQEGRIWRKWPPGNDPKRTQRSRIRNDLAHFNILDSGCKALNLTYVTNAVRSLMAYDKKQKNVLPKSIKRILGDYGLCINWRMSPEDRLTNAVIFPAKETHLSDIRRFDKDFGVAFDVPKASPRFASMAQALFDFGASGHAQAIKQKEDTIGRKIRYEDRALQGYAGDPKWIKDNARTEFWYKNEVTG